MGTAGRVARGVLSRVVVVGAVDDLVHVAVLAAWRLFDLPRGEPDVCGRIAHGSTSTAGSWAIACHSIVSPTRRRRSTTFRPLVWNAPLSASHVSSLKFTVSTTSVPFSTAPIESPR